MHRFLGMVLCCTTAVLQGCRTATTHRCSCNDEQGCCHLATDCSSAAKGMHRFLGEVAVLHFCMAVGLYELHKLIGVVAVTSKAVATLPLIAAVLQRDAQVSGHGCCAALLQFCRAVELQQLIIVVAMMSKAVATLPLTAAVLQRACTGL